MAMAWRREKRRRGEKSGEAWSMGRIDGSSSRPLVSAPVILLGNVKMLELARDWLAAVGSVNKKRGPVLHSLAVAEELHTCRRRRLWPHCLSYVLSFLNA